LPLIFLSEGDNASTLELRIIATLARAFLPANHLFDEKNALAKAKALQKNRLNTVPEMRAVFFGDRLQLLFWF